ncbi:hypothetical protein DL764_007036 [Monosporascus ibericus]|uniref:Uncharacterized protein n=1 Tax=Monosporascus ibericus TaxID=155417 RepID=A0A4Q4T365_9PEZI|nr:hypothetical protein DL764_007036 [Monosporascus ibericus]
MLRMTDGTRGDNLQHGNCAMHWEKAVEELLHGPVRLQRDSDGDIVNPRADSELDSNDGQVAVPHQLSKVHVMGLGLLSKTQGPGGFDHRSQGDASLVSGIGVFQSGAWRRRRFVKGGTTAERRSPVRPSVRSSWMLGVRP